MEGSDHVADICPTRTDHEGLSLLPQARLELQDSLASCQYDTPISGGVEQRVLFEKYIYNYYHLPASSITFLIAHAFLVTRVDVASWNNSCWLV